MELGRNAEPLENLCRPCFEAVAVEADDEVLDLGVAVSIEMILRGLENSFLLCEGIPQLRMAHHGQVENWGVFETEVILFEHPDPEALGDRHLPFARLFPVGEDPQKRALAGPVRTHEPVTAPRVELKAHTSEQRLVAIGLCEIGDRDHGSGEYQGTGMDSRHVDHSTFGSSEMT